MKVRRSLRASVTGACVIGMLAVVPGVGIGSAAASTSTAKASGKPVVLAMDTAITGTISFPEMKASANAAAKAINAAGGVKGRPLQIKVCDSGPDPTNANKEIACARETAADASVLAEISDYSNNGDTITPIFQQAGLAVISPIPLSSAQFSLDNSFPLMGSEGGGLGVMMYDQGAKQVGIAYVDVAAAAQSVTFGNLFLGKGRNGAPYSAKSAVPLTATDYSSYAAALDSTQGVTLSLAPNQSPLFLQAVQQGGYKYKVGQSALGLNPKDVKTLGKAAEGLYLAAGLPLSSDTSNPGIRRFNKEMTKYAKGAVLSEPALNAWLAVHAFAQVANENVQGDLTRDSVLTAWKALTTFNIYNMLPDGLNLQVSPLGISALSRLTNTWLQYGQVKNGKIVPVSKGWVSLVTAP